MNALQAYKLTRKSMRSIERKIGREYQWTGEQVFQLMLRHYNAKNAEACFYLHVWPVIACYLRRRTARKQLSFILECA
jgi:hypothetical protein